MFEGGARRGSRAALAFAMVVAGCGGDAPARDASVSDGQTLDAGGDGGPPCVHDADCDDHFFCNGDEICQPGSVAADHRGCVRLQVPRCAMGQTCDEAAARCQTDCGVALDADGDRHSAVVCGGDDCDDDDAHRFPGNPEVCDDAAHDEDCDASTIGVRDADGDGSVDAACCNVGPAGARVCGDDCNDTRTHIGPHATEICNGIDDDCNGAVDDGVLVPAFEDHDHDLHGDAAHPVQVCPFAAGVSLVGDDCDDADPARHPAQPEICDGVDNDCNGTIDDFTHAVTWYADLDGDLFGSAASGTMISCTVLAGFSLLPTDCDDAHRGISPAANEVCNGLDDDCNGLADFIVAPGDFEDDDGDGAIDARCPRVGTDCDDLDEAVHPGATEICDGKDDDCNGMIDDGMGTATWFADLDGDGFGDDHAATTTSCARPAARVAQGGDCDDTSDAIHPGVIDGCDGHDDDCNGVVDDDAARYAYYVDADGDGAGVGVVTLSCVLLAGQASLPNDCDETNAAIHPGAMELCNGIDDDCDGLIDDAPGTFYPDDDADGHGEVGSLGRTGCAPSGAYAPNMDDCDDTNASVHPGAREVCDAIDDDCDGTVDGPSAAAICAAPHGTPTCTGGACAILSCATNYGDCDHTVFDGCEADLRVSPTHCGSCARACGVADACVAGACTVSPFVQVTGGNSFTCARRASGGVACWGLGTSGQLGDGGFVSSSTPVATTVTDAIDIAAGADHACAVRRGGGVVCWGGDANGQLGDGGSTINRALPAPVVGITDAVDVTAGGSFTCAVHATGAVSCWGNNQFGQLGSDPVTVASSTTPIAVAGLSDAVTLSAGDIFACALQAGNTVSCWGYGSLGCLGDGTSPYYRYTPGPVSGVTTAIAIASAENDRGTCAVLGSGDVRCWGNEASGQFGDGTPGSDLLPVAPVGVHDAVASMLGYATACWLRMGGTVTCAGYGAAGETGDGMLTSSYVPGPDIPTLSGVTSIGAGNDTLCATLGTGGVVCWGSNGNGEVGDGTTTQRDVPTPVLGLP